ncbi:carbohydrate ABC transporter permease [Naumannella cuiyingiana]|uniref:Alpha-1,4-digalacturonate transport system permease protein n=1 Tax=Naumannella cuiyingiana TaxID=1347891 RepID=A0A7Z0IMH0_9ACTN|nr:carbohydrate ABC transporter permease [Naumannella cuiyingiana]NYI72620.1 alpha-1,4-digalacturonate transport system permease protein [Naumannella cuiyingiana]
MSAPATNPPDVAAGRPAAPTWTGTGRRPPTGWAIARYVILIATALLILGPLVWTFVSSFKTPTELAQRPPVILPAQWSLENYTGALERFPFATYLRNSVIVTVAATALTVVINTMCAYGLAKYNFRGRNFVFLLVLATIMIPLQVILIPVYQMAYQLGLVNTLWGLIIPPAATPTGVFLIRQYMLGIPDDLIEAARVDGASEFGIFARVVLPLCGPPIAVVTIFSIMWRWNDFLWPLVISQQQDNYTLPVALAQFNAELIVPFNYILAMSVVSMVPVIIIFLFLQRQIVTGIASSGLK